MAGTDPSGARPIVPKAPDGEEFTEDNYPIQWSQADRERGSFRHPAGGKSYETAVAVVGNDGGGLTDNLSTVLEDIRAELQSAREAREFPETQNVNIIAQPAAAPGLFVSDPVVVGYGASSGALDANDAYGDLMEVVVPEFGRLTTLKLFDPDDVIAAGTLSIWVFSVKPAAPPASDAAIASGYTDFDGRSMVTAQAFGSMTDIGAGRFLEIVDIDSDYHAPIGKLWFQLSTTETPTPTAGGMPIVTFFILNLT